MTSPINPQQGTLVGPSGDFMLDLRPTVTGLIPPVPQGTPPVVIWGGCAITEYRTSDAVGTQLQLATNPEQITGFALQSASMVSRDPSPVPVGYSGMTILFARCGSGAQLVLQADPAVLAIFNRPGGAPINTSVSWDFANQRVIPYTSAAGVLPVHSIARTISTASVIVKNIWGKLRWRSPANALIVTL